MCLYYCYEDSSKEAYSIGWDKHSLDQVNNFIMSKCTHTSTDPSMLLVKAHVQFAALEKTIKMYLAPTNDSIELERQLNRFIHEVVKIILCLILQFKSYTHI